MIQEPPLPDQIGYYIDAKHLQPEAITQFASTFHKSPLGLIQLDNFLTPKLVQHCSRFLSNKAKYGNLYGYHSRKKSPTAIKTEWLSVEEEERFFFYEMLDATADNPLDIGAITFIKLRHFLQSNAFKAFIELLISRNLDAITPVRVHRMKTGHFLKPHNDHGKNREFAFIIYLSPNWQPEYGGNLLITDLDGSESVYNPIYNRLLIFDVHKHKHHTISEVFENNRVGNRNGRISVNGWFYKTTEQSH